jgi:hypothetical protein
MRNTRKDSMSDHRKGQTNLRLSDEGRRLLDLISEMYGISMADVVEISVRKYGQELGLWRPPGSRDQPKGPAKNQ